MADFQFKSGTWQDIPDAAHPDETGSIRVMYPPAQDRDGNGVPCGAFGLPRIEIQSGWMTGTGWDWWQDRFSTETAEYVAVYITAYNERRGAWAKYTGNLARPTSEKLTPGPSVARTIYTGVSIIVLDVTETT